jgi:hypothetical protein
MQDLCNMKRNRSKEATRRNQRMVTHSRKNSVDRSASEKKLEIRQSAKRVARDTFFFSGWRTSLTYKLARRGYEWLNAVEEGEEEVLYLMR